MSGNTVISNVLPNPSNGLAYDGGADSAHQGYAVGPGYKTVKVESKFKTMKDMTNSGTLVSRSKAAQAFGVSITYNPLTEDEFNRVYGFLLEKQGQLKPFFVPLPQYDDPQDNTLANHSPTISFQVDNTLGYSAGVTQMLIDASGYDSTSDGQLRPGDMFTISDSQNSNHTKAYKITRVQTFTDYSGSQPNTDELRINFVPPLQKDVADNAVINYQNPKIKVIQKSDTLNYNLRTDGLYTFTLNLEEVQ